jgi:2OG-Fe(II) oxygenase superfamily
LQYIEIEYNQELKPLEAVLSGVKQPGDFFVCGAMEMPMPRVEVEGAGTLSFPVPDAQIAAIVRRATRAPYGRGQETIVDTSVRNVWQIAPGKIKIDGKSWEANFEIILSKAKAGLGCGDATVTAELYKLLVYDRGGFFLAHRDTEKIEGMFGTLVVTLPSMYRGGGLRVRHAGREVTLDTHAADPSELSYVAFYADCEHEALPVQEGNRVCLVYNLIQKHSKGRNRTLKAPEYESRITTAAAILERFLKGPGAPAKIAWLLEHQYSSAGLSFSALKGADAAKARVLVQAAARAQCAAHLGIVHIGESGAAEADYEYFYRSRRNRYGYYDDAEEEDDHEDASFTVATVDDTWRYVDEWRDSDDRAIQFGRIPLAGRELLPAGALDGEPPDQKRLTEASGNEGATYERSYHRAALVLWRGNRTLEVLLQAGVVAALPYLRQLANGGRRTRQEGIEVAGRILEAWPREAQRWDRSSIRREWPGPADRIEMITALTKLNVPALIELYIREAVASGYDGSENAALVASISLLGDEQAAAVLSNLVSVQMPAHPNECTGLLLALSENRSLCFSEVAEAAVAVLDSIGTPDSKPEIFDWEPEESQRSLGPQFLENLLRALPRFKGGALCGAAAEKIASRPETFSPVMMVVPAIERIGVGRRQKTAAVDSSVRHLWTSAAEFLLRRSEVRPEPPSDWGRNVEISCSCPDCRELEAFARDPAGRVHRFRVNKERRRHLHHTIDRYRLDMTHVTERVGSPQTLVCTKDRRSFDQRMKQYRDEITAMRRLVRLAPKSGGAALSRRMEAAVKRAADLKQGEASARK